MYTLKVLSIVFLGVLLLSFGKSLAQAMRNGDFASGQSWATARRDSAGIAPDPQQYASTAIVQVYTAQTYGWRGLFAVHPWIIFKKAGESQYHRYEVISWGGNNVVRRDYTIADGFWFGARPGLLLEHRGAEAEAMIPQIEAAINSYPWPHTYHAWPGPNSNTFLAHIGREVPELKLNMPANAIGKDYRSLTNPMGLPPSGKGLQVSLLGVLALTIGREEGVEVNILGLNLGVNLDPLTLRLPFIGQPGHGSAEKPQS
ncbi:DUF3750 domain-containing protein [Pantoea sp. B65]|uniref:DUF3750 domain-containing protein n=1 Tax=Pantoea sp. B65 TaxID=2813359 RepID=UPI0039B68FD4